MRRLLIALSAAVMMILTSSMDASAISSKVVQSTPAQVAPVDPLAGLTDEEVEAGYEELVAALKTEGAKTRNGIVSYRVKGYGVLKLADVAAPCATCLGGGSDSRGWYVSFNRFDQQQLLGVGGGALALAICAIPAVGWLACGVAAILVGVATSYVIEYGRCPTSRPSLRVYVSSRTGRCV